jgi:hypothetical protein
MREPITTGNPGSLSLFFDILRDEWAPQFTGKQTPRQIAFDVLFGLAIPVLCLVFTPHVIRWDSVLIALRTEIRVFVAFEIVVFAAWLLLGPRFKGLASLVAGALFGGALAAIAFGILLLPFTLPLLALLIGVFGLLPFPTAFVFLRHAIRAGALSCHSIPRRQAILAAVLGCVLALGIVLAAPQAARLWHPAPL